MKNLKISVAILVASTFVVSCSKSDVFEQSQSSVSDLKMNQYKTSFVQKYGEIAPDQSWDFSTVSNAKASTRGEEEISGVKWMDFNMICQFMQTVNIDRDNVMAYFESKGVIKTWNPRLAVEMFATFVHNVSKSDKFYHHLEVCQGDVRTEIVPNIKVGYNFQGNQWHNAGTFGGLINSSDNFRTVNTKSLSSDAYWVAYYTYNDNYSPTKKQKNAEIIANPQKFEIKDYKEYTVNGRTYWGFDCNLDGKYSDLIFMVQNIDPVKPVEKRYMVEDLGAIGDFDFNDIVFDVLQDAQGKQKCIIRAMGGTLDFTLKIGSTEWSKGEDGAKKGYQTNVMYNTDPKDYDGAKVLAEFDVEEWDPTENNVSVSVVSKENTGVITVIPFPKKGEVPMMIALDTFQAWMYEKESLPKNWWYILDEEDTEVEE